MLSSSHLNGGKKIGLIGLGLVGTALAERLLASGYSVLGYDLDGTRCSLLKELGGEPAKDPLRIAHECGRILLSLPDSDVVSGVIEQMGSVLTQGQILLDTTTGDPECAAATSARLSAGGVHYIDAAISGSSEHVRRGEALLLIGGDPESVSSCADLFSGFARSWYRVGPAGCGQKMKLVANLVLGINRAALAEGLALAGALGLSERDALTILREGIAYSRIMDTKGEKMIQRNFKPQGKLSQHLKDVRLILDAGDAAGIKLLLSEAHRKLLEKADTDGFGDADNSAVIQAYGGLEDYRKAE